MKRDEAADHAMPRIFERQDAPASDDAGLVASCEREGPETHPSRPLAGASAPLAGGTTCFHGRET